MADLSRLTKAQLIEMINVLAGNLATVDGLWFLEMEEKCGLESALESDVMVWKRFAPLEARRLKENMNIEESGIDGLNKGLALSNFTITKGYENIIDRNGDKIVLTYINCRTQKARIRDGKGEFPCKPVGLGYFQEFARAFGNDISVSCLMCPPDEHPEDAWCAWEFIQNPG